MSRGRDSLAGSERLGVLDGLLSGRVCGWVTPLATGAPRSVTLYLDGTMWGESPANLYRADLGALGGGYCGFAMDLPEHVLDGRRHRVEVFCEGRPLVNSPLAAVIAKVDRVPTPVRDHLGMTFRHRVTVVAICRDEVDSVDEWAVYHHLVGVDRILVYDNESRDGTSERLARLEALGLIEVIRWPTDPAWSIGPQIPAYEDAARRVGVSSEWLLPLDLDEFVVPKCDGGLAGLLSRYPTVAGLAIHWRVFGSAGQDAAGPGLVTERFTRCAPSAHPINNVVKTAVRTPYLTRMGVHVPFVSRGCIVDETETLIDPFKGGIGEAPSHSLCQVNHYFTKSRQEWDRKKKRGRADVAEPSRLKYRTNDDFVTHDRNEDRCCVGAAYAAQIRAYLESVRARELVLE